MYEYALSHDKRAEEQTGIKSGLEDTINHAAEPIKLSPGDVKSAINTHPGVFVYPELKEDNPAPGSYSVAGFLKQREEILERAKARFEFLNSIAGRHGLKLTIENEPLANFEPTKIFDGRPTLIYKPLSTPEALEYISGGVQTFDINHFGATTKVQERMEMNDIDQTELFRVLGIKSWDEYKTKFTDQSAYFPKTTTAVHASNTTGIGVHLKDLKDIKNWGAEGTNEGIISRENLRATMNRACEGGFPSVIEVNYDVKNIPENQYKEADTFLDHVFGK